MVGQVTTSLYSVYFRDVERNVKVVVTTVETLYETIFHKCQYSTRNERIFSTKRFRALIFGKINQRGKMILHIHVSICGNNTLGDASCVFTV